MEFPFLHAVGVNARLGGAINPGRSYDEAADSVHLGRNGGFDFMITELVMGIDSTIVIKPSIQDSDIPAGTVSETSVFSLQDELIFNGGGATLGIQKSEGIFRLDLADFHSELKLPFWQDELRFSGRLSGTSSSWNTEDLSLSTTELTSKLQISKSLTKYDLELQSLRIVTLIL